MWGEQSPNPPGDQSKIGAAMNDRGPGDGGFSCLGCGGCLSVFVIVASFAFFVAAGTDWLLQAIAAAIIVAFLIGIIALERERRG